MLEDTLPLRRRKQLAAMERIQQAAFTLLTERGYEATKVTDIAAAAEVSPSSVYRYFDTKDGVFAWDPLGDPFTVLLEGHLGDLPPMDAVEAAFLEVAATLDPQLEAILRERTRLLLSIPQLRAAMRAMINGFGDELATLFVRGGIPELDAQVVAAATAARLMVGVEYWAGPESEATLAEVAGDIFHALRTHAA